MKRAARHKISCAWLSDYSGRRLSTEYVYLTNFRRKATLYMNMWLTLVHESPNYPYLLSNVDTSTEYVSVFIFWQKIICYMIRQVISFQKLNIETNLVDVFSEVFCFNSERTYKRGKLYTRHVPAFWNLKKYTVHNQDSGPVHVC